MGESPVAHGDPHGQTPALSQPCLVLGPVPHAIGSLDIFALGALEMAHRGAVCPSIARAGELYTKAGVMTKPALLRDGALISALLRQACPDAESLSSGAPSVREAERRYVLRLPN